MKQRVAYELSQQPLQEPPTASELAWWKQARKRIGFRVALGFGVPLGAVNVLAAILRDSERSPWIGAGVALLIAALGGWAVWRFTEHNYLNQEIRWKRIREDVAGQGELPDGERGNSLQP